MEVSMRSLATACGVAVVGLWIGGCDPTSTDKGEVIVPPQIDSDDTSDTDSCPPDAFDCGAAVVEGVEFYVAAEQAQGCVRTSLVNQGWSCPSQSQCTLVRLFEPARSIDLEPFCLEGVYGPALFDPSDPVEVADRCWPRLNTAGQSWFFGGVDQDSFLDALGEDALHELGDPSAPFDPSAVASAAEMTVRDDCPLAAVSVNQRPFITWDDSTTGVVSGDLVDPECECREAFANEIGADFIFGVDPLLSSFQWLEPGGEMVASTLRGYVYGAAQPARFLQGRVDGEEIAYGGQMLKDGYAGFSVPMTISHSAGTVTIQPSNQDDIWWQATEESTGEPIAFAVAPSQPVSGTVDFAAGTWSLSFSQTLAGAETVHVTLGGQVWAP